MGCVTSNNLGIMAFAQRLMQVGVVQFLGVSSPCASERDAMVLDGCNSYLHMRDAAFGTQDDP